MTGIRILFIYVCSFLSGSESHIQIRDGNIFKNHSRDEEKFVNDFLIFYKIILIYLISTKIKTIFTQLKPIFSLYKKQKQLPMLFPKKMEVTSLRIV